MNNRKTKKLISIIAVITVVLLLVAVYVYKKTDRDTSTSGAKENTQSEESLKDNNSNSSESNGNTEASDKNNQIETDQPIDFQAIASENKPIIVNYGSEGCPPCRKLKPILQSLSDKYGENLYIRYVDVWKHPELQGNFRFEYIPSQVFFNKDGSPYQPSQKLIDNYQFQVIKDNNGNHLYTLHQGFLPQEILTEIIEDIV